MSTNPYFERWVKIFKYSLIYLSIHFSQTKSAWNVHRYLYVDGHHYPSAALKYTHIELLAKCLRAVHLRRTLDQIGQSWRLFFVITDIVWYFRGQFGVVGGSGRLVVVAFIVVGLNCTPTQTAGIRIRIYRRPTRTSLMDTRMPLSLSTALPSFRVMNNDRFALGSAWDVGLFRPPTWFNPRRWRSRVHFNWTFYVD